MHIHACKRVYTCVRCNRYYHLFIYIHHVIVPTQVCTGTYTYTCRYTMTYAHTFGYSSAQITYAYRHTVICAHTFALSYAHIYTHTRKRMRTNMYAHMHLCMDKGAHLQTYAIHVKLGYVKRTCVCLDIVTSTTGTNFHPTVRHMSTSNENISAGFCKRSANVWSGHLKLAQLDGSQWLLPRVRCMLAINEMIIAESENTAPMSRAHMCSQRRSSL